MPDEYDTIVIGGGIAGLACAARLAQAGKGVVVLEQHTMPGGYCSSFRRRGVTFDAAVHWVNDPQAINRFLRALDVPELEFLQIRPVSRMLGPDRGSDLLLTDDRAQVEASIRRSYPVVDPAQLRGLLDLAETVYREIKHMPQDGSPELMPWWSKLLMGARVPLGMRHVMQLGKVTLPGILERYLPGHELSGLRAALHSCVPLTGMPAMAILMWIAMGLHGEAYYPKGSTQRIADALALAIRKHGGEMRFSSKVTRLQARNGRVEGVVLAGGAELRARQVVSAIDAHQTFLSLLDPAWVPAGFRRRITGSRVYESIFMVSLVTDLDPADYGLDGTDVMLNAARDPEEMFASGDPARLSLGVSFNTNRDPSCRAEESRGVHGIQIKVPASFDQENCWRSGPGLERGADYRAYKALFAAGLLARAEVLLPGLKEHILHLDIATPLTLQRYTGNYRGSMMGWKDMQLWQQRVPFVKGLFHAGQWTFPGPGVNTVLQSGLNAAELVLRD